MEDSGERRGWRRERRRGRRVVEDRLRVVRPRDRRQPELRGRRDARRAAWPALHLADDPRGTLARRQRAAGGVQRRARPARALRERVPTQERPAAVPAARPRRPAVRVGARGDARDGAAAGGAAPPRRWPRRLLRLARRAGALPLADIPPHRHRLHRHPHPRLHRRRDGDTSPPRLRRSCREPRCRPARDRGGARRVQRRWRRRRRRGRQRRRWGARHARAGERERGGARQQGGVRGGAAHGDSRRRGAGGDAVRPVRGVRQRLRVPRLRAPRPVRQLQQRSSSSGSGGSRTGGGRAVLLGARRCGRWCQSHLGPQWWCTLCHRQKPRRCALCRGARSRRRCGGRPSPP